MPWWPDRLATSSKEGALASNLAMLSLNVKQTLSSAADTLSHIGSFFVSPSLQSPEEASQKDLWGKSIKDLQSKARSGQLVWWRIYIQFSFLYPSPSSRGLHLGIAT